MLILSPVKMSARRMELDMLWEVTSVHVIGIITGENESIRLASKNEERN